MAQRLSLPDSVPAAFYYLTERWDGQGVLKRARGDELPLPLRIALLARDGSYLAAVGGADYAGQVIAERAGKAHDPAVARLLARHHRDVLESEACVG